LLYSVDGRMDGWRKELDRAEIERGSSPRPHPAFLAGSRDQGSGSDADAAV